MLHILHGGVCAKSESLVVCARCTVLCCVCSLFSLWVCVLAVQSLVVCARCTVSGCVCSLYTLWVCVLAVQIQAKLYMFDKETQSWIEKGRGVISLNDICQSSSEGIFQSRLGMLTCSKSGSVCSEW